MRPVLAYGLGASVVLVLLAQWWPAGRPALAGAVPANPGSAAIQARVGTGEPTLAHAVQLKAPPLPATLPPLDLQTQGNDPFVPWQPSSAPQPAAPKVAAPPPASLLVPTPAPVPPTPQAPQQALRYLGFFSSPAGATVVLLADGEASFPVTVGTQLPNGYVVQSLGPDAVRLLYAPTATTVDIPLPAAAASRR